MERKGYYLWDRGIINLKIISFIVLDRDFLDFLNVTNNLDFESETDITLMNFDLAKNARFQLNLKSRKINNDVNVYRENFMPVVDPENSKCYFKYNATKYIVETR